MQNSREFKAEINIRDNTLDLLYGPAIMIDSLKFQDKRLAK